MDVAVGVTAGIAVGGTGVAVEGSKVGTGTGAKVEQETSRTNSKNPIRERGRDMRRIVNQNPPAGLREGGKFSRQDLF